MIMRGAILAAGVLCALTAVPLNGARQAPAAAGSVEAAAQAAVVQRYCGSCHSQARHSGDVVLERINLSDVSASAQTLEKVVRKLRSGTMPPPGAPRPDPA